MDKKQILGSPMNDTVILQQLVVLMTMLMLPLIGRQHCSGLCGEPFLHDVMVFLCLSPCQMFGLHLWLMTDFIFLYGYTFYIPNTDYHESHRTSFTFGICIRCVLQHLVA